MLQNKKGFTLIELLVVIAIIGILAGILIVLMTSATTSANDTKRKADLSQIIKTLLMYNATSSAYPISATACNIGGSGGTACDSSVLAVLGGLATIKDPSGGYYTYASSDGVSFVISAKMSSGENYSYNSLSSKYSSDSSCISGGGLTCTELPPVGNYRIIKYTLSGTTTGTINWTVPSGVEQVEYLIVAGGGSGGDSLGSSGGGGAGGVLTNFGGTKLSVSGAYEIKVGAGGQAVYPLNGNNGENSSFAGNIAIGGGGGGISYADGNGGGSSGGGGNRKSPGAASQGYSGGSGTGSPAYAAGGGGGAGGPGGNGSGVSGGASGAGGIGTTSSITGSSEMYAAGGGGGGDAYPGRCIGGLGGSGIGGNGCTGSLTNGTNGAANTGSGGGGSGSTSTTTFLSAGNGGSGIVIIRYQVP